jgi:hypothetical protein
MTPFTKFQRSLARWLGTPGYLREWARRSEAARKGWAKRREKLAKLRFEFKEVVKL